MNSILMTDKEKICAEIERQYETLKVEYSKTKGAYVAGRMDALDYVEQFINSLPEELTPKGYDEAYLNECIAKASKTWKGVDVDKFMDEVRGRESDDLEEAAKEWAEAHYKDLVSQQVCSDDFMAGAIWQKQKMMEGAVEGYVNYYEDSGGILMAEAQVGCPCHTGDKVKLLIIKDDETIND